MKNMDKGHIILNQYYNFILQIIKMNKKAILTSKKAFENQSDEEILEVLELTEQITYKLLDTLKEMDQLESNLDQ